MVTTNATRTVAEGTNFNNDTTVAASSIAIAAVPLPDLQVTQHHTAAQWRALRQHRAYLVHRHQQRQGAHAGPGVVRLGHPVAGSRRSARPTWASSTPPARAATRSFNNQPMVVGFANPSYLDVGQSYQQNVTVTLPITAQGTWYVYVVPDGTGAHHPFAMPEMSRTDKLAISRGLQRHAQPAARPGRAQRHGARAGLLRQADADPAGPCQQRHRARPRPAPGPTPCTCRRIRRWTPMPRCWARSPTRGPGGRQQLHQQPRPLTCPLASAGRFISWSRRTCMARCSRMA